jgi:tetratricopeptide (TPR) repeat protein
MAHRTFRLSIAPEDVPEVRRVIDFDGRCSLDDVHVRIASEYRLDDGEHLYAFFLSGRYWDEATAYFDPRTDGPRADRALLFRLGLTPGKCFAYLLDFGMEQRFAVTVVAVTEVERALESPQLVETVGEAPNAAQPEDEEIDDTAPPELAELVPLAEAFLDLDDELEEPDDPDDLDESDDLDEEPEVTTPADGSSGLRAAGDAALALVNALGQNAERFLELDQWLLARSLGVRLLDLPMQLSHGGEAELAVTLARALAFVDRELMEGDLAIILASAGLRDEALAQLESNLSQAKDRSLVEGKAGDTYRALGDLPAAEAYYRRSLAEASTRSDRTAALLRVSSCLIDQGRAAEADALLTEAKKVQAAIEAKANPPSVGRNEPCPCGSGKKYKKCHGA